MLTRRAWMERAALYAAAAAAGGLWPLRIEAGQTAGMPGTDSVLTNGRFVDSRGVIADTITIRNGRLARVGEPLPLAPDARTIDLGGRTVIPGLFDAHVHFTITRAENDVHLAAFQSIARDHPIAELRWALIHLQQIETPVLKALLALGAGASAQTWTYLSAAGGPPFRRIVDSGIPAGVGTDSTNVAPLDPWLTLFYMTTGRNLAGDLTNDGQQLSRLEALRLYTEGAAWFSFDDHHAGSFHEGKYADLAVLSDDYLSVPEEAIRRIESVLTMVGGRVVHASDPFVTAEVRP